MYKIKSVQRRYFSTHYTFKNNHEEYFFIKNWYNFQRTWNLYTDKVIPFREDIKTSDLWQKNAEEQLGRKEYLISLKSAQRSLINSPFNFKTHETLSLLFQEKGFSDDALCEYRLSRELKKRNNRKFSKRKPDVVYTIYNNKEKTTKEKVIINNDTEKTETTYKPRLLRKKALKKSVAIFACLALSFNIYAQKAELDITLKRPDNYPATGIITVTGNDSIRSEELIDGTAYFLLRNETGIKNQKDDLNILVYPNPVINGFVTIDLHNNNNKNYTIEAYNITGQLIDKAKMPFDNSLRIPAGYESIILHFSNDKEKLYSSRLVTLSDHNTNIKLLTHNKSQTLKGAEITILDDYEISYTDSTENLEGKIWYENIPPGTKYTIDEELMWSIKEFSTQGKTSKDATVIYDASGNVLKTVETVDGIIPYSSFSERFNNEIGLPVSVIISAPNADDVVLNFNPYRNDTIKIDTLLNRYFNINHTSNTDEGTYTIYDLQNNVLASGLVDNASNFSMRKDSIDTKIITESTGYEIDTLLQQLFPGGNAANITMIPLTSDDYDTLYISGVSSINALINAKRASVSIGTANADGSGNFAVTQWITDNIPVSGIDLVLEYSAANSDAENDTVHANKGDTIPTIILNNHYNNTVTGDDGASVAITDINGNLLTSGLTGETLQFKVRENEKEIIRAINKQYYDEYKDTIIAVPGLTEKTISLIANYLLRDNGTTETNIEYKNIDGSAFGNSQTGQDFTFKQASDSVQLVRVLTKANYENAQDTAWFKPGDNISATILNGIYDQLVNGSAGASVAITDIDGNPLTSGLTGETLKFTAPVDQIEIIRAINKQYYDEYKDTIIAVPGLTEKTVSLIANYAVTPTMRNGTGNVEILDQFGTSMSSGVSGNTQNIKQAADSLQNAKIRFTATDAQTKEIIKSLYPGTNNTSTILDWIYENNITGKNGAQILGEFNGKTVFDYITGTTAETKTFQDTLLTGNINIKQILENYITSEQNIDIDKGVNDLILETMVGKYTSKINNAKTGATITWKAGENTLLSGVDANELYQELAQDLNSVKAILQFTNYLNDTIKFENTPVGLTEKVAGQMIGKYTSNIDEVILGTNVKWENMPSGSLIIQGQDLNSLYQELPQDLASVRAILEKTGYINDTVSFVNVGPGITTKSANQQVAPSNYTLEGKLVTDDGEDRHRNVVNALRITRSDGQEIYASTDANGEFNKSIEAFPGEKIEVSLNIPGQRERTLSIIYDPQKTSGQGFEFPKNRLVETSWDIYQADSAFVSPEEISAHPLTVITMSNEMAANDTLKWMMEGSENVLRGSSLYVGDSPIKKYISTTNYELFTQMTQTEIDKTKQAMNKTEELMNLSEIGPALPFETAFTISPDKVFVPYNSLINMTRSGVGYYNTTDYEDPEVEGRFVGWYVRGPPAIIIDGYVKELMGPSARDPPAESGIPTDNEFAFDVRADTIYGLNNIGKTLMMWNHNSEPETGAMGEKSLGDWDANIQDWKENGYLAMNNKVYNINELESGILLASEGKDLSTQEGRTSYLNEIAQNAFDLIICDFGCPVIIMIYLFTN